MALDTLPTLTRAQLQEVFKDPRTLLAFEAILRQVSETIPSDFTAFQELDFIVGALDPLIPNAYLLSSGAGLNLTLNPGSASIALAHTSVTPGSYTNASFTVDAFGRLTVAASGAVGVSSFSGGTTGLLPSVATAGAIILSGTLAIANGGTGATTATGARTALGLGTAATQNTGASGATVPLLNGLNTWSQGQTVPYVVTTPTTVAGLPSAATAGAGARAFVTDALAPVFGAAVVGGGAVKVPVYSDGASWLVG